MDGNVGDAPIRVLGIGGSTRRESKSLVLLASALRMAAARAADAFILCSPTYHGTVSGAVKNALDALNFLGDDDPPYLAGKPVALMALGGGGAANVLNSLHHASRALNGLTIPTTVIASGSSIHEGEVTDESVRRRLHAMGHELLELAVRLRRWLTSSSGTDLEESHERESLGTGRSGCAQLARRGQGAGTVQQHRVHGRAA